MKKSHIVLTRHSVGQYIISAFVVHETDVIHLCFMVTSTGKLNTKIPWPHVHACNSSGSDFLNTAPLSTSPMHVSVRGAQDGHRSTTSDDVLMFFF